MKTTAYVKLIDNSGRIAIPKKVRSKFDIKAGDAFEICYDSDGNLVLCKYQLIPLRNMNH